MPDKFSRDDLFDYVDGILDLDQSRRIDDALQRDKELAARLAFVQHLVQVFEEEDIDSTIHDAGDDKRASTVVRRDDQKNKSQATRGRRFSASLIGLAAGLLLAVFAANAYLRPPKSVAYLDDAFGKITKDPSGAISGLEAYPAAWRDEIESMLLKESVEVPVGLLQFAAGSKGRGGQSAYLTPVGTVVRSQTPTFRWNEIESALEYRVALDPKDIPESKPIATTEWTPSQPLVRGRVYSWQLTVIRNGTELLVDEYPLPKLKVLDEASEKELVALEVDARGSHLVLAVVYLHFGLVDDANHELAQLAEENPTSELAGNIASSL